MYKEFITFGNIEIGKRELDYSKYLININNVDINKIISNKASFGKMGLKHFMCYKDDECICKINK